MTLLYIITFQSKKFVVAMVMFVMDIITILIFNFLQDYTLCIPHGLKSKSDTRLL